MSKRDSIAPEFTGKPNKPYPELGVWQIFREA